MTETDTPTASPPRAPRMVPVRDCPLCGASDAPPFFRVPDRLHGTPGVFTYRRCAACGTVFQDPRVTAEDLALCYPAGYYTHSAAHTDVPTWNDGATAQPRGWRGRAAQAVRASVRRAPVPGPLGWLGRLLARHPGVRRWVYSGLIDELQPRRAGVRRALDVGCGAGELMYRLRKAGWQAEGVEWDAVAAGVARRVSGCPVWEGDFREVALDPGRFDLIVVSHCFEHLDDPIRSLQHIEELLAPTGRAVLIYPNPRSLGAWIFGDAWLHWDPPRHLVIPPARALAAVARRVGLVSLGWRTDSPHVGNDYVFSRSFREGIDHETLHMIHESKWDRLGAWIERALLRLGLPIGQEVILTLGKGGPTGR